MELASHTLFTIAMGTKTYFRDPQSSWQHGTIVSLGGASSWQIPVANMLPDAQVTWWSNKDILHTGSDSSCCPAL